MAIDPSRMAEFTKYAQFAIAHKAEYLAVEKATGVTWPHVAVLHRRESDADFNTYLGNGEPLNRVTRLVPKGRGPFSSFLAGAIDAIAIDGLDKVIDWRLEKILYYCEIFNGLGYEFRNLPSPYIWGGTNQQKPGKYISDGEFDQNVMDTQPGCAPILLMIAKLDPTVKFVRETPMGVEPPKEPTVATDIEQVLAIVEKLASEITLVRMEMATLRSLVTGEKPPVKPAEPVKPTDPVVVTPPPAIEPLDLKTLILSIIGAVVAPATGVSETVDKGTIGALLPYIGMAASAFGIPSWILPLAGGLLSKFATGAKK